MLEYWIMLPFKSTLLGNQETMKTPYETIFDQHTKDKFFYRVFLDFFQIISEMYIISVKVKLEHHISETIERLKKAHLVEST